MNYCRLQLKGVRLKSVLSIKRCFVKRKGDLRTVPPDNRYFCTVFLLLCLGRAIGIKIIKGYHALFRDNNNSKKPLKCTTMFLGLKNT